MQQHEKTSLRYVFFRLYSNDELLDFLKEQLKNGLVLDHCKGNFFFFRRWQLQNARLCVISIPCSKPRIEDDDEVQEYLDINGFGPLFDVIVTGDRVAHGKPAPDIYLRAAELLQLAPAECAGVEDSLNGVKAVRAAGMRSVMIPDLLPYGPDFAPYVDVRLNSLHELLGALEEKE